MGMKEYIEEIYLTKEEAEKEIRAWDEYSIYEFEIVPFGDRWKLIMRLRGPMMG